MVVRSSQLLLYIILSPIIKLVCLIKKGYTYYSNIYCLCLKWFARKIDFSKKKANNGNK